MEFPTVYTAVIYTPNYDGDFARGHYVGGAYDSDLKIVSNTDLDQFKTDVTEAIIASQGDYELTIMFNGYCDDTNGGEYNAKMVEADKTIDKLTNEVKKAAETLSKERAAERERLANERVEAEAAYRAKKKIEDDLALLAKLKAEYEGK